MIEARRAPTLLAGRHGKRWHRVARRAPICQRPAPILNPLWLLLGLGRRSLYPADALRKLCVPGHRALERAHPEVACDFVGAFANLRAARGLPLILYKLMHPLLQLDQLLRGFLGASRRQLHCCLGVFKDIEITDLTVRTVPADHIPVKLRVPVHRFLRVNLCGPQASCRRGRRATTQICVCVCVRRCPYTICSEGRHSGV